MKDAAAEGMLKARAALDRKLQKASRALITAQTGLQAAIKAYNKAHDAAVTQKRPVTTVRHKGLVGGITKAREKLTKRLLELQQVEYEHKAYFTPY